MVAPFFKWVNSTGRKDCFLVTTQIAFFVVMSFGLYFAASIFDLTMVKSCFAYCPKIKTKYCPEYTPKQHGFLPLNDYVSERR